MKLKELETLCQKPHWKEVGNWMVRKIERPLALYVTWFLIRTPVTANQVTALSILCGLLGGLCFLFSQPVLFFIGILLFHFWYLLDHVDGQIARYRKSESLSGVYLDFLSHYAVHAVFFLGIGLSAYLQTKNLIVLFLALSSGFGTVFMGIFYDTRYKAIFQRLEKIKKAEWTGYQDPLAQLESKKQKETIFVKRIFIVLYKSAEIHVALTAVTVIALLQFWIPSFLWAPWTFWLTLYYGVLFPVLFGFRVYEHIHRRKIEEEFDSYFKVLE